MLRWTLLAKDDANFSVKECRHEGVLNSVQSENQFRLGGDSSVDSLERANDLLLLKNGRNGDAKSALISSVYVFDS